MKRESEKEREREREREPADDRASPPLSSLLSMQAAHTAAVNQPVFSATFHTTRKSPKLDTSTTRF